MGRRGRPPRRLQRGTYQDVILPHTVLRRIDCVLDPKKVAVLKRNGELKDLGLENRDAQLRKAATPNSDLDLLVIGRTSDPKRTNARLQGLGERLGRSIDAWFLTPEEARALDARGDRRFRRALKGVRILGAWQ